MEIGKDEVARIAKLARLELTGSETDAFSRQLSAILTYVEQLRTLDTASVGVEAPPRESNIFRPDEVGPSLMQDAALANAPDAADGCFRVPRIIEDR